MPDCLSLQVTRLSALMPVERRLVSMGAAKVLQLFPLNVKQKTVVAGLSVTKGELLNPLYRLISIIM